MTKLHSTKIIFCSKINHQRVRRFPLSRSCKPLTALKMSYSAPHHQNLRLAKHSLDPSQAGVSGVCGQALFSNRYGKSCPGCSGHPACSFSLSRSRLGRNLPCHSPRIREPDVPGGRFRGSHHALLRAARLARYRAGFLGAQSARRGCCAGCPAPDQRIWHCHWRHSPGIACHYADHAPRR